MSHNNYFEFKTIMKSTFNAIKVLFLMLLCVSSVYGQNGPELYAPFTHPDMLPELSARGESGVGVQTMTITNDDYIDPFDGQTKPRSLKVEVWYPSSMTEGSQALYANQTRQGSPFEITGNAIRDAAPSRLQDISLVVLSHGYTGYRTIMYYLGEHLASHGYLVVGIDHTDSTNEDVDAKKNPFGGFRSTLVNRSRDQQYVLDYFSNAANTLESLGDNVSIKNAGIVGYSMGGYGALNTIGACYNFSDQFTSRMIMTKDEEKIKAAQKALNTCAAGQSPENFKVDPRWQSMIAFAPWGGGQGVFEDGSISKIKVPSLYISGSQDDVSGYNEIKKQFEQTTAADSYLLTYVNARHNIAPHPAPPEAWRSEYDFGHYYEPSWSTLQLNRINEHFALAMMNCYLRSDESACEYLELPESSDQPRVEGKLSEAWKGFDNRYGTGMKWHMNKVAK